MSATDPVEYRDIHLSACRYRRQGLVCSTCGAVSRAADQALARLAANLPLAS